MPSILILAIVILVGFYISKNNYKNRATTINDNLLEFANEIMKIYNNLSEENQNNFKISLTPRETSVFNNLQSNFYHGTSNINNLQSSMFHMEDLMKKLKKQNI